MRKTLWTPAVLAAASAVAFSTMWALAQPADTTVPPPTNAPVGGMNAAAAATGPAPTTQEALTDASYFIGFSMGERFKSQEIQVDVAALNAGLTDAIGGQPSKVTEQKAQQALMTIDAMVMQREMAKQQEASAKNKAEGTAFLEQNKSKPGVKTTPSGIQYTVTTEGTGPNPKATDIVKVHYTGKLLNGETFDSSVTRGEPIEIPLDQVIPGWTEGIQLFKVGGKGTLWIPSDLAYGDNPRPGGKIEPGSTLVFDIEVLGITPPATQPTGFGGNLPTTLPNLNDLPEPMPQQ